MPLVDLYRPDQCTISFELFPPKTEKGTENLWRHVDQLMEFSPGYLTCTYGAGGSTRDKTLDIVTEVKRRFDVPVASHLTCVGATADDLRGYLDEATSRDIDFIVALRGDPPQGEERFQPTAGGLTYANELVELIRTEFPQFGIAVAGYPETHQEAPSPELDLQNLKRKVDAGGEIVITQLFFDNADFFRFQTACEEQGVRCPVVPGILPVTNLAQIQRITTLCGAKLPESFVAEMSKQDDDQWQFDVGVEFARKQVAELMEAGVPGVHFYVLNKSTATSSVLRSLET